MAQVSWVRQLILAALLLVLGGFAYWVQYKHKPAEDGEKGQSKKIIPIKGETIQSIRLFDGKKTYEWHCLDAAAKLCKVGDNSKWALDQPIKGRADDSNVNSLISSISYLEYTDTVDLAPETQEKRRAFLKEYGLSPEELGSASVRRLDIKTDKGEQVAYFGAANPLQDNVYVVVEKAPTGQKPAGKPDVVKVFVSPAYFSTNFQHDLNYWRDKKLFNFVTTDVTSFKLVNQEKKETIEGTKKDGQWTLHLKDGDAPGDIENVDSFLTGLSYLTAKGFVSDNRADGKARKTLQGAKPFATVALDRAQPGKKETDHVVLTAYEKGKAPNASLYASVSGSDPLYELQPASRTQIGKTIKDLRLNKLITSMDRFNAKRLEFSGTPIGATPLQLVQENGKWMIEPDKKEADNEKFQQTLDKLGGNRIQEFLTGESIPSGEKDGITMTFGDDGDPAKHKILFWRANGNLYAKDLLSKRGEAFLVDSSVAGGLPWNRGYYDKQVKAAAKAK